MEVLERKITGLGKAIASLTLLAALGGLARAQQKPAPIERRDPATQANAEPIENAPLPVKVMGNKDMGYIRVALPDNGTLQYQAGMGEPQTIVHWTSSNFKISGYTLDDGKLYAFPYRPGVSTPIEDNKKLEAMQHLQQKLITAFDDPNHTISDIGAELKVLKDAGPHPISQIELRPEVRIPLVNRF